MTIGSPEPILHNGKSWMSVPIPAIIMALWIRAASSVESSPLAAPTISIGAILATNIARICCSPKGIAFIIGTRPFREYILLIDASCLTVFLFFIFMFSCLVGNVVIGILTYPVAAAECDGACGSIHAVNNCE